MLNLSTPTTLLQVVTGGAVTSIAVHASFVDLGVATGSVVPGSKNTLIAVAATTIIVPPPAAGIDRNVKFLSVNNQSGTPCQVTIQSTDGVNVVNLFSIILKPDWTIQYNSDGSGFVLYDDSGNIQVSPADVIIVSITNLNISAGTTSQNLASVVFSNSNNVSFGLNGSTVTASALGAINLSAGTTSNLSSAFTFANSNGVSFGLDAGTVTGSVVQGLTAINVSAGTTSNNLSAITFSNSNGISFGLNGGTITGSVAMAVGTVSCFSQDADFVTNFSAGQAVLSLQKLSLPMNLLATELAIIADFAGVSNLSGAVTLSHGVYTLAGGTASLASSGSRAIWASGSATTASSQFGGASGTRYRTVVVNYSMSPGDYLFGWALSTAGAVTVRVFGRAAMNLVGGFDGIETNYFLNGLSTATVAALPVSIAATDTGYVRTGFSALLQPGAILVGTH